MRSLAVCAGCLLMVGVGANPQDSFDREKSAREYVQFLVLQLDQWSKEFPQQFYAAVNSPKAPKRGPLSLANPSSAWPRSVQLPA